MLTCPVCGCTESVRCYRTATVDAGTKMDRKRRCVKCGIEFSTEEKITPGTVRQRKKSKKSRGNANTTN